jgi:hypothetical protein
MRWIRLTQPGKSSEHQNLPESERFGTKCNINRRQSFRGYLNRMNRTHHTAITQFSSYSPCRTVSSAAADRPPQRRSGSVCSGAPPKNSATANPQRFL